MSDTMEIAGLLTAGRVRQGFVASSHPRTEATLACVNVFLTQGVTDLRMTQRHKLMTCAPCLRRT